MKETNEKPIDKMGHINELMAGVKDVFDSDKYKEYLSFCSKFHNYSARNTYLIYKQCPQASYVAGFKKWQEFKRFVQKGEKGIQIVARSEKKFNVEVEKKNEQTGKTDIEKVQKIIPNYIPVYVFDVSQTKGEPLPTLTEELKGTVDNYKDLLKAIEKTSVFPIEFVQLQDSTKGICNYTNQKIYIKENMSELQSIKTAIHEMAHAELHNPLEISADEKKTLNTRTKEIQAESIAFIIAKNLDLDTSDYSFAYVAGWSADKELEQLQASLDTIQQKSSELIDKIKDNFNIIQLEKSNSLSNSKADGLSDRNAIDKNSIEFKIMQAKEKSKNLELTSDKNNIKTKTKSFER